MKRVQALAVLLAIAAVGLAEPAVGQPASNPAAPKVAAVGATAAASVEAKTSPSAPAGTLAAAPADENMTPLPPPERAADGKPVPVTLVADVDLSLQRMQVMIGGKVIHSWPISSGVRGHETPTGTFRPDWLARMWYSRKYDLAPMPNAVFFKDGAAIHGTQSVRLLGQPASHGCVRLSLANSATFYGLVQKHGLAGTRIKVHGQPRFRSEAIARSDANRTRTPLASAAPAYRIDAYGRIHVVARPATATALPAPRAYAPPASGGLVFPGDPPSYGAVRSYSRYSGYGRY
jgi:lipoprotein-anchoring transpeptidase ErfK/SrfK